MLNMISTGFWPRFAQKRLGMHCVGPIDTMLLTTGVALVVRREKLPLAALLLAIGGYRSWKAAQPASCPVCDAD